MIVSSTLKTPVLLELGVKVYLDLIVDVPSAFGATDLPKNAAKTMIVKA